MTNTTDEARGAEAAAFGEPMYAISYSKGPTWQPGRPLREQPFQSHTAYLRGLSDAGRLASAGVVLGDDFSGIAFVRAKDADEADAIMANDPAVVSGLFVATVKPWLMVFDSASAAS